MEKHFVRRANGNRYIKVERVHDQRNSPGNGKKSKHYFLRAPEKSSERKIQSAKSPGQIETPKKNAPVSMVKDWGKPRTEKLHYWWFAKEMEPRWNSGSAKIREEIVGYFQKFNLPLAVFNPWSKILSSFVFKTPLPKEETAGQEKNPHPQSPRYFKEIFRGRKPNQIWPLGKRCGQFKTRGVGVTGGGGRKKKPPFGRQEGRKHVSRWSRNCYQKNALRKESHLNHEGQWHRKYSSWRDKNPIIFLWTIFILTKRKHRKWKQINQNFLSQRYWF